MISNLVDQRWVFLLCTALLFALFAEAAVKRRRPWGLPSMMAYITIGVWYLFDPLYEPNDYLIFSETVFENACMQVICFLIVFRLSVVPLAQRMAPTSSANRQVATKSAGRILQMAAVLWALLLAYGTVRMDGNLIGALLPLEGRAGVNMWQRGAIGGEGGFLVSAAAYLYTLVCASFGILLPFLKKGPERWTAFGLIVLCLPFFLLQGSRNVALAVLVPGVASFLLYSRVDLLRKATITIALFALLEFWFRIVIAYRDTGFGEIIAGDIDPSVTSTKHLGLGMMMELCFVNSYYDAGLLQLSLGGRYLAELINIIPRAIWPDKPLIGIDYAVLRGFAALNTLGVNATISTGIIGQGFVNFGPIFGPTVGAMLLAFWAAVLSRFRQQRSSLPRLMLFVLGLGLTFNLGRDFTLLVLWPAIFGYVIVRILERRRPHRLAESATPAAHSGRGT